MNSSSTFPVTSVAPLTGSLGYGLTQLAGAGGSGLSRGRTFTVLAVLAGATAVLAIVYYAVRYFRSPALLIENGNPYSKALSKVLINSTTEEGKVKISHEVLFGKKADVLELTRKKDGKNVWCAGDRTIRYSEQLAIDCCTRPLDKLIVGEHEWSKESRPELLELLRALDEVAQKNSEDLLRLTELMNQGPMNNIFDNVYLDLFTRSNVLIAGNTGAIDGARGYRVFRSQDDHLLLDGVVETYVNVLSVNDEPPNEERRGLLRMALLVDLTAWKAVVNASIEI